MNMDRQKKRRGSMASIISLVIAIILSMPVYALADETIGFDDAVGEASVEIEAAVDENAPEILSDSNEPQEEAEEILYVDQDEEVLVRDDISEDVFTAEEPQKEAEFDVDDAIPESISDPGGQLEEEPEEILSDDFGDELFEEDVPEEDVLAEDTAANEEALSDIEETLPEGISFPAEEVGEEADDLPMMDAEQPVENMTDEQDESNTDLIDEGSNTDTEFFTVYFDVCGHGKEVEPVLRAKGSVLEKPDDPQDEGFTFIGWYREDACEREWDFETDTVTEDITLYAGWEENVQEESTEQSTEQAQDVEETIEISEAVEEPTWTLSIPGSQAVAYKAERTEIGTIAVKDASHFAEGQAISVILDYSSFSSNDYSIPIVITVIQNGTEYVWDDGTSCSLNPDGSDPITVYVNISAEAWDAAPHGSYAMSIQFRSALLWR